MLSATTKNLFEFTVAQCGIAAWPLIRHRNRGRVVAVFNSSFYIDVDGAMMCVVGAEVAPGPVNIVAGLPKQLSWRSCGLKDGANVSITGGCMTVAQIYRFNISAATLWRPPPAPGNWSYKSLRAGLSSLRKWAGSQAASSGIARLLQVERHHCRHNGLHYPDFAQLRAARLALAVALKYPVGGAVADMDPICSLVGMGGGLTPAGDDFIGGVMIALRGFGYDQASDRIRDAVLPVARRETNNISLGHLECASRGMGCKPVHDFLHAVLQGRGDDIARLSDEIGKIGQTSGWDIAAGMVCALEAILDHCQADGAEQPVPAC